MPEPTYVHKVALDDIKISDANVRDSDREKGIEELAESVKRLGLLQPVVLIGKPDSPPYDLLIGQRRYLAHRRLGSSEIKAVFMPPGDSFKALAASLAENLNRVEVNYADAAKAVAELYSHYERNINQVMQATGLSKRMINEYLRVEEQASDRMKQLLSQGEVKKEDVKRALRAAGDNIEKAERLLDLMTERGLTTHQKARVVRCAREAPTAAAEEIIDKAEQPRVERAMTVPLRREIREALENAVEAFDLTAEEIATQALEEWLSDKGFIASQQLPLGDA